jgi:hypothetical protein
MRARALRLLVAMLAAGATLAALAAFGGEAAETERVVEILTDDADGERRETKVWCVALDGAVFVRTNDSRWLANIRRGSKIALRVAGEESAVVAEEVTDEGLRQQVEALYKLKYGTLQRVMSALRVREPSVLRLSPAEP